MAGLCRENQLRMVGYPMIYDRFIHSNGGWDEMISANSIKGFVLHHWFPLITPAGPAIKPFFLSRGYVEGG